MPNQEWSSLGEEIKELVQSAVDSKDFKQLNESLSKTVNSALDNVGDSLRKAGEKIDYASYKRARAQKPWERKPKVYESEPKKSPLFGRTGGMSSAGMLLVIFGAILMGGLGLGILTLILVAVFTQEMFSGIAISIGVMIPLLLGSLVMTWKGGSLLGRVKRFRTYVQQLRVTGYCSIEELARSVNKSRSFVLRDLRGMVSKKLFPQGHIDKQESCMMISDEIYKQYQETQMQLEQRQREEARMEALPDETKKVIAEGKEYLKRIKESNDAIPGEEVSEKISRMELVIQKIFNRVEQHPELVGELRKFMEYYLPTTVKLLDAYEELDAQPVQGANILSSKREIEESLDTINLAFENLLDSFFQDTAWDISSDISVMKTMMAQEGLTGSDFDRR